MGWGRCSVLPKLLKPRKCVIPHPRPHGGCIQHDPFPSKFAPFWGPRLLSSRTKDAWCRLSSNVGKTRGKEASSGSLFPWDGLYGSALALLGPRRCRGIPPGVSPAPAWGKSPPRIPRSRSSSPQGCPAGAALLPAPSPSGYIHHYPYHSFHGRPGSVFPTVEPGRQGWDEFFPAVGKDAGLTSRMAGDSGRGDARQRCQRCIRRKHLMASP